MKKSTKEYNKELKQKAHELFGPKTWNEYWIQNGKNCVVVFIRPVSVGGISAWVENHYSEGTYWNVTAFTKEGLDLLHEDFTKIIKGDIRNLNASRIK